MIIEPKETIKKVEKYNLYVDKPLGKGAFGVVFRAWDNEKKIDVAVKMVDLATFNLDELTIKLMKQETQSLFTLRDSPNENLVKTYEILRSASKLYIIMELCDGGHLEGYLKENYGNVLGMGGKPQVPEQVVRLIFRDIVNGYRELAANKIVHRDLKPANVLLNKGRWKIADFGFAKKIEGSIADLTTVVGTPLYCAPQILNEALKYSDKCDIWSLGVMLFECLYGAYPFVGKNPEDLAKVIKTTPLTFPATPKVSDDLKYLISEMLIEDEKKRLDMDKLFSYKWVNDMVPEFDVMDFDEGDTGTHEISRQKYEIGFPSKA